MGCDQMLDHYLSSSGYRTRDIGWINGPRVHDIQWLEPTVVLPSSKFWDFGTSGFRDFGPRRFPHLFPPNLPTSEILIYFIPFGPTSHSCFQQPRWHVACLGGSMSPSTMSSGPTTFTFLFGSSGFGSLCVRTSRFFPIAKSKLRN
jgi:hypothetical protein